MASSSKDLPGKPQVEEPQAIYYGAEKRNGTETDRKANRQADEVG